MRVMKKISPYLYGEPHGLSEDYQFLESGMATEFSQFTTKVRLVRCPRCRLLLPELPDFNVYKCGVVLQAPVDQFLDDVSRDSGAVISNVISSSMGEVRARTQVSNETSEGLITEPDPPVIQSLDHVSRDLGTGSSSVISASVGEVRTRNQMMNRRSQSFSFNETAALGNHLGLLSAETESSTSSVSSMSISHHSSSNGANNDYHDMLRPKIKANFEDWIFLIASIILETLSAAFDQASTPSKSHFALFGMLLTIVAVITCIWELIHKVKRERVKFGRWGMLWWFYYSHPRGTLFGTFPDICALVGAIPQCIFSTVQYHYHCRHADNPINLCLWPIVFLFCLVGLRLIKNQTRNTAHDIVLPEISVATE